MSKDESNQKHSGGLFDSIKNIADNTEKTVEDAHKPHGIFDSVNRMGDNIRNDVSEAHGKGGLLGALDQAMQGAHNSVSDVQSANTGGKVLQGSDNSGYYNPDNTPSQSASDSAGRFGDAMTQATGGNQVGTPYGSDSGSTSVGGTGQWVTDGSNTGNDTIQGGGSDEFQGSGGVGSAEFMDRLRQGHEAAGGEYNSDMRSADNISNDAGSTNLSADSSGNFGGNSNNQPV